MQKIPKQ